MHSELAVRRLALRDGGVCNTALVGGSGKVGIGIGIGGNLMDVLVDAFLFGGTMDVK